MSPIPVKIEAQVYQTKILKDNTLKFKLYSGDSAARLLGINDAG